MKCHLTELHEHLANALEQNSSKDQDLTLVQRQVSNLQAEIDDLRRELLDKEGQLSEALNQDSQKSAEVID